MTNNQFPYSKIIRENGEVVSPDDHNKQEHQIEYITDVLGNYDLLSGSVESRLSTLSGSLGSTITDITAIQDDVLTIQGDIVTINGDIVDIQNDVITIQGDIVTINGNIISLDNRITSLENAPSPVSDLNDLGDVITSTPEVGQVLTYAGPIGTGSEWTNQFPIRTLGELQDVSIDNANPGDSLILSPGTGTDGETWVPEDRRLTVASGLPGASEESEIFPVSEIRFISNSGTGENHQAVQISDGVVYIGAGPPPDALSTLSGLSGLVSGRMSDDSIPSATTYPPSLNAGDVYSSITQTSSWAFTTAGNEFANASLGNLILNINGVDVANVDLMANFDEVNRGVGQNIANYDVTGTGSPITNGVVTFSGGTLVINSVGPFTSIPTDQYQRGSATINVTMTALRKGYNIVILRHEIGTSTSSATLEWFYDVNTAGGANDPDISASDLSENTPTLNFLSGISYYGTGSTFDLDVTGNDLFNNVYVASDAPISYSQNWTTVGSVLITDPSVSGVAAPPLIGDVMTITNFTLTVLSGLQITDAQTTLTPSDPYGSYSSVITVNKNFAIMSSGPNSTDIFDDFTDERYRLPSTTNFDVVVPSMPGPPLLWDSTISLTTGARAGELQVYDHLEAITKNRIKYPLFDYSSSFNPQPNPNYSTLPLGARTYYRVFRSTSGDKASGVITFPGISESDLTAGITLRIKVPTKTVWLDLIKAYNGGTFPTGAPLIGGLDGEGCRINSGVYSLDINGSIEFSLGEIGTDLSSDRQLILEITYASSAVTEITGTGSGLSINW